jgi:hypothetical protein
MGIKDWFGGGEKAKKKEEYHDALKDAVKGGRLSSTEMKKLDKLREELDVTDAAEDKTQLRREIYNAAVGASKDKGGISSTGVHELAKIQKFLALRDDQVEKTKFQVNRLRTLDDIKKGNLPLVPGNSIALRDVVLEPGEVAHYSLAVDILDQGSLGTAEGVPLEKSKPYVAGSAGIHAIPESGAKEMGEATLVITSKRLVLKTRGRLAAVKLGADAQLFVYSDGLRLARTVGNTLLRFRTRSDEAPEIVGELISALLRD